MNSKSIRCFISLLFVLPVILIFIHCSDDNATSPENGPNRPPDTWLSVAGIDFLESIMRIHFYWGGSDIDGEVIQYQWTVSVFDTIYDWYNISRTDSIYLFVFEDDPPPIDCIFYIRAIDDDLSMDDSPAYCFFNY